MCWKQPLAQHWRCNGPSPLPHVTSTLDNGCTKPNSFFQFLCKPWASHFQVLAFSFFSLGTVLEEKEKKPHVSTVVCVIPLNLTWDLSVSTWYFMVLKLQKYRFQFILYYSIRNIKKKKTQLIKNRRRIHYPRDEDNNQHTHNES